MAKRFYKNVAVDEREGAVVVTLDGRVLKTPGKMVMRFDTSAQAELTRAEWDAQADEILLHTMPCTRLVGVACEQTPNRRDELLKEFCAYTSTDLLCYRADAPADLAGQQAKKWQPILDWAAQDLSISLASTTSIVAITQPEASLNAARAFADGLNDIHLTLLLHYTASLGSAVLAAAVLEGYKTAEEAFALSRLDQAFQNERWGSDDEVVEKNQILLGELIALEQLI